MKEYIILEKVDTFPSLVRHMTGVNINPVASQSLRIKSFKTYEEAVEFGNTLDYGVTIYESIAKIEIQHKETKINEHTDNSTSESNPILRSSTDVSRKTVL